VLHAGGTPAAECDGYLRLHGRLDHQRPRVEKAQGRAFGKKLIATIGDSTFLHSGITGLIDAVYNRGGFTVAILDNRVTAMTGHQENPGTGRTLKERRPMP